jgi:hypothetical protein
MQIIQNTAEEHTQGTKRVVADPKVEDEEK